MAYTAPDLPYAFDAIEPAIDAKTMEIHHDKHHVGYATKLSKAVEGTEYDGKPVEELLSSLSTLPEKIQTAVRNNGGGFYNHNLFWNILKPNPGSGDNKPTGELADAIQSDLGGYDKFKEDFTTAATGQFGSGWAWLCVNPQGKLHVTSTANQDTTFNPEGFGGHGQGHQPILGVDVWEHAYYLKYQNKRPDYVEAFFGAIHWDHVAENYRKAKG